MGYLIILLSALTLTALVFAPTMAMLVLIPPVREAASRSPRTRNRISVAIGLMSFGVMLALLMGLAWLVVGITLGYSADVHSPLPKTDEDKRQLVSNRKIAFDAHKEMWLRSVLPFPSSCNTTEFECKQAQRVISEFEYPDPHGTGINTTIFLSMSGVSLCAATMSIFFARLYTRPPQANGPITPPSA
jgi:hypothetical protein